MAEPPAGAGGAGISPVITRLLEAAAVPGLPTGDNAHLVTTAHLQLATSAVLSTVLGAAHAVKRLANDSTPATQAQFALSAVSINVELQVFLLPLESRVSRRGNHYYRKKKWNGERRQPAPSLTKIQ